MKTMGHRFKTHMYKKSGSDTKNTKESCFILKTRKLKKHFDTMFNTDGRHSNVVIVFKKTHRKADLTVTVQSLGHNFTIHRGKSLVLNLSEGKQALRFKVGNENIKKITTVNSDNVTYYYVSWNGRKATIDQKIEGNSFSGRLDRHAVPCVKELPKKQESAARISICIGIAMLVAVLSLGIIQSNYLKNESVDPVIEPSTDISMDNELDPLISSNPYRNIDDWMQYYSDCGIEVIDVASDVLYEYADCYSGKVIRTVVSISEQNDIGSIFKATSSDNNTRFSEMLLYSSRHVSFPSIPNDTLVLVIGTIDEEDFYGSTIILYNCHVIEYGDAAETQKNEIGKNREQQLRSVESLKNDIINNPDYHREMYESDDPFMTVAYSEVLRIPGEFKGKNVVISGQVTQISKGLCGSSILKVNTIDGDWIIDCFSSDESTILVGDILVFYGKCRGIRSCISDGTVVTLPCMVSDNQVVFRRTEFETDSM